MQTFKNLLDRKIAESQDAIAYHKAKIAELEAQKQNADDSIKKWLGNNFESSSGLTEEFAAFYQDFNRHVKKLLPGYSVKLLRGHFCANGFITNVLTSKIVYISCPDVRFFKDGWFNRLLIRTAKHDKDYTGGANYMIKLNDLKLKADELTK